MRILKGRVFWYEGFGNRPGLHLLVDSMPKLDEFRFERKGQFYYAELDGAVRFFSWDGKPDRGYGGSTFPITMADGSKVDLVGPWSSNSAAMNAHGFKPCLEASITDEPAALERGWTFYSSAVSLKLMMDACEAGLIEVPAYKASRNGGNLDLVELAKSGKVFPAGTRGTLVRHVSSRGQLASDLSAEQAHAFLDVSSETACFTDFDWLAPGEFYLEPAALLPDGTVWRKPGR